ncbi:MMPL family transporter [Stackebrandtia nassauensis]|uniref:MMPL domain protein n=1 Tax=Stackebrandtia nassauensis (strain DSM 44728 / CIP 108903 / NRRL B-16338 / NBRC 102104 / LLR-40K-21) TaxID=446470 RepID=D3PVA6_STANL|nr:MMPL family transporter [Stackebrandtia nassauensis]ADD41159.1 MMPL domain protein [Stackebrandtia nassauensis DSM 44728]
MLPENPPPTVAPPSRGALVERIAAWSANHRLAAILGWLGLVVIAVGSNFLITGEDARAVDPGQSGTASQVMDANGAEAPPLENVLVQSKDDDRKLADDPELEAAITDLTAALRDLSSATDEVRSPTDADGEALVSEDGRSGLVTFTVAGPPEEFRAHYDEAVAAIGKVADQHPDVRLAQAGDISLASAVDETIKDDFGRAEFISLPATLLILLVVFGALVAASIPLILAVTTVATAFGLLQLLGQWIPMNSATSSMVLLIGMAVSVDYTLFYVRRQREERAAGRDTAEALRVTARTSGRVVVISGLTVMLCLVGLLFTGLDNFNGLTVGTIVIVSVAILGSVTVLPALLAGLGDRIDRGRIPWLGRRRARARTSPGWSAVAGAVTRRPWLWGGVATLALLVLALPMLDMRTQDAAQTNSLPRSIPTVDAAVRMQESFPGAASPAKVVLWETGDVDDAQLDAAMTALRHEVADGDDGLADPVSVATVESVTVLRVALAGSGTDPRSTAALERLRDKVLPDTVGQVDGVGFAVMGKTAFAHDFNERLRGHTLPVFVFVLVLAFVLLVVSFRSLAVPIVSIALNLLSVGASYGLVTWIFQYGNLEALLGFQSYGAVVSWLPLVMFVILFGLSMDYHIFILSRVRERWLDGVGTRDAIVGGIGASAGVVSSAAFIMTAVFTVFIALTAIENKMLGVGMAAAILIDATVVRGVLLPAAMAVLGERAWTLPRWLAWLPGRGH